MAPQAASRRHSLIYDGSLSGTLSVLTLRALALAVSRAGGDADALLRQVGIDPSVLDRADARIEAERAFDAFESAPAYVTREAFCLEVAEVIPLGTMAVLDFAVRSSPTMGEALERVIRYYALIDDGSTLSVERDGDVARFVGERSEPVSPRAATELLFGLVVARGRGFTGLAWPMREVSFVQPSPRDPRGHELFFGAPVRFRRPRNELVFDASWLTVPCRAHDPELATFLDREVSALLDRLPRPDSFLDDVRRAVTEAIRGSDPRLETTAKRLSMGTRTLQRRLREHLTSHRAIVEEVREGLARQLLADKRTSVGEIAYLLGFSDTSAFHHAFVRWTGTSPSAYRNESARST